MNSTHGRSFVYIYRHQYRMTTVGDFIHRAKRLSVVCQGPSYLDCVLEYAELQAMARACPEIVLHDASALADEDKDDANGGEGDGA